MTDQDPPSMEIPDSEAIATAQLVLPLVLTRLESDPVWSLAMLNAVRKQLGTCEGAEGASRPLRIGDVLAIPAGEALAEAHKQAVQNQLSSAMILAQIALREPNALGNAKTNARLLFASILERQGRLKEAAKVVGQACSEDPSNENALSDRDRIAGTLRAKARASSDISKAERVAVLLTLLQLSGWNFADAKAFFTASCSLLRGP
ncbi:hypothetical protein EH31_05975 [Erythrobacter longus]|uniref:Uncharacterized protein n=1 Tax=Erythrobacter longus TaxID=1044 RepID=A0A074N2P7_ERYLO|nr:hypothetical protein [Erythrobacter longus]KEO92212.1 hypothetical protein EH31_05975 [Erythrobacter longus]